MGGGTKQLARKAQRGDLDAFIALLTPYEEKIWKLCWCYTGRMETASNNGVKVISSVWKRILNEKTASEPTEIILDEIQELLRGQRKEG